MPKGAKPLPALSERLAAPGRVPEQIVGRDDELVEVGVGMAAVDEALAPVAEGKLALGYRGAFEVEHGA